MKFKLKTVRKRVTYIRKIGPHTTFTLFCQVEWRRQIEFICPENMKRNDT